MVRGSLERWELLGYALSANDVDQRMGNGVFELSRGGDYKVNSICLAYMKCEAASVDLINDSIIVC